MLMCDNALIVGWVWLHEEVVSYCLEGLGMMSTSGHDLFECLLMSCCIRLRNRQIVDYFVAISNYLLSHSSLPHP
jgi:hypothetical protein